MKSEGWRWRENVPGEWWLLQLMARTGKPERNCQAAGWTKTSFPQSIITLWNRLPQFSGDRQYISLKKWFDKIDDQVTKCDVLKTSKTLVSVSWEDILRKDHSLHIFFVIHTFWYHFADKGGGLTQCGDSVSLQLGLAHLNSLIPGQLTPLSWHREHGWLPPVASGEQK